MSDQNRSVDSPDAPNGRIWHRSTVRMSVIAQRHRHIRVDHPSTRLLTPEEARLFGQWLIEAADVAEGKPEAVDA